MDLCFILKLYCLDKLEIKIIVVNLTSMRFNVMKYLPIRLAHLPGGEEIKKAVENFKHYISHSIEADLKYKIGKGYGTVHHFYKF